MCGIMGLVKPSGVRMSSHEVEQILQSLMILSESRGTEAAGMAISIGDVIRITKVPYSASKFVDTRHFEDLFGSVEQSLANPNTHFSLIGHVRMVTDGSEYSHGNNQPIERGGLVGVHNGIIVNADDLSRQFNIVRDSAVDTEVLLGVIAESLRQSNSISDGLSSAFQQIEGTASIAMLFQDMDTLLLATNNGSLYTYDGGNNRPVLFASEKFILNRLIDSRKFGFSTKGYSIKHLKANQAIACDIPSATLFRFHIGGPSENKIQMNAHEKQIDDVSPSVSISSWQLAGPEDDDSSLLLYDEEAISHLQRCTRCVLPRTFPFIEFDDEGVCNFCHSYESPRFYGEEPLQKLAGSARNDDGLADCLVMLSGGRDSSYALHYVKKKLGLNPIAYTYDWGMVTDIARRNISRMCAQLGVEHILVSADIREKRGNIRKNVLAWLKQPDLGMVPLFMAGDKHWYYYANRVMKQLNLNLVFLSTNDLERTHFKVGFCGIPPMKDDLRRGGGLTDKIQLIGYYGWNILKNPYYMNKSLLDTFSGFLSFYQLPRSYVRTYEYVKWDEDKINQTLINEYDWETDPETRTTWRIGDGTAQFYNYIYHTMAGFTENDTFRSNQIREGLITRGEALEFIRKENRPRYNGIKWYLTAIGLKNHFNYVIRHINSAPRIY